MTSDISGENSISTGYTPSSGEENAPVVRPRSPFDVGDDSVEGVPETGIDPSQFSFEKISEQSGLIPSTAEPDTSVKVGGTSSAVPTPISPLLPATSLGVTLPAPVIGPSAHTSAPASSYQFSRSANWARSEDMPLDYPTEAMIDEWCSEEMRRDRFFDISCARYKFLYGRDIFKGMFERHSLLCSFEGRIDRSKSPFPDGIQIFDCVRGNKPRWSKSRHLEHPDDEQSDFVVRFVHDQYVLSYHAPADAS